MTNFCQIHLTCANKDEADKIAKTLLGKRLVACAKQVSVKSDFVWQGKIEHANEVLLIMDTKDDLFEKIEAEIAKLHSYNTFVMQAIPISRVSSKAADWLKDNLNGQA